MRCRGKSARAKRISEVSSEGGKSAALDLRIAQCRRAADDSRRFAAEAPTGSGADRRSRLPDPSDGREFSRCRAVAQPSLRVGPSYEPVRPRCLVCNGVVAGFHAIRRAELSAGLTDVRHECRAVFFLQTQHATSTCRSNGASRLASTASPSFMCPWMQRQIRAPDGH